MCEGQEPFKTVLVSTIFVCLLPLTCDLQNQTPSLKSDTEEISSAGLTRPVGSNGNADMLAQSESEAWVDPPSENRRASDVSRFDVDSEPEERE